MIRVREADGNDLDAVVEIGRRTWPATNGELYDPDFVPLFLDKWWTKDACIPSIRAGRTMVAQAGDEVVGMASYGPLEGRQIVWKLYVLPDWQGRGVGGQLLGAVLERIGHQPTFMSFAAGNDSAARFTRSVGFVEDHREPQTDMPDLVWMRRDPT
nr:GNAT family N-acetyltransferase [Kineosphaera limosa]